MELFITPAHCRWTYPYSRRYSRPFRFSFLNSVAVVAAFSISARPATLSPVPLRHIEGVTHGHSVTSSVNRVTRPFSLSLLLDSVKIPPYEVYSWRWSSYTYHHHLQNSRSRATAFLRGFCQTASGFRCFPFRNNTSRQPWVQLPTRRTRFLYLCPSVIVCPR
jgi:hypothetical protein